MKRFHVFVFSQIIYHHGSVEHRFLQEKLCFQKKGETKYDLTCSWCGFHYPPKSIWFIVINWIASSQSFFWSALRKTNIVPNKKLVARPFFFWEGLFQGAMLVGGSCDWTRHFGCEGAPNLLFQHTQWLERHEITIHPVRSANISPTHDI